ncbi:MAG: hypothetical protein KC518_11480 [Candidatus Cloacimonetes bacterium]|nr:hypothetical protein [Candidatus Cloacimonadota bacterium]
MTLLTRTASLIVLLIFITVPGHSLSRITFTNSMGQTLGTPVVGTLNSLFTYSYSGNTIYATAPAGASKALIEVLDEELIESMVDVRVGKLNMDLVFEGHSIGALIPAPGFPDGQLLRLSTPPEVAPANRVLMVKNLGFGRDDFPVPVGLLVRAAVHPFARIQVLNCRFTGFSANGIYAQDADTELSINGCTFDCLDPETSIKMIRFSGTSTESSLRRTQIQNCQFTVQLRSPGRLQPITGIYAYGAVPRQLALMNNVFRGFFANAVYINQLGLGSAWILGCDFEGLPVGELAPDLPASMVRAVSLSSLEEGRVQYCRFRAVAECAVYQNDCANALALNNVITDFGVTDAGVSLPSGFEIRKVNAGLWNPDAIENLFADYHQLYASDDQAENALTNLFYEQTAILITGSGTASSRIADNSVIRSAGMAINMQCGVSETLRTYAHIVSGNLISDALNSSIRVISSNTEVSGNTIISAIDPELYQRLLDRWGCDSSGTPRTFNALFQNSCLIVVPSEDGTRHVRIANNVIQRAATAILVEGHGLEPNEIPLGLEIHDNIIDVTLEPYIRNYVVDNQCQDSLRMTFSEWRGIWVGDAQDVSILRNRIHNGHVVRSHGEDWYVGGIGIQMDGVSYSEIRDNLVDGVTCALALATYINLSGHVPNMRNLNCADNVFHNIQGHSLPARTPTKTHYLPAFKLGIFDGSIDTGMPTVCDFSNLTVRNNLFIWNLDDDPHASSSLAQQHFNIGYPLRGPLPECSLPDAPEHSGFSFRGNKGNLGGREDLPLIDNQSLLVRGQDTCNMDYPSYTLAEQNQFWAELQSWNPGSIVNSQLNRPDSEFQRVPSHPGFDEVRIVNAIGGPESVRISIPPYTSVLAP